MSDIEQILYPTVLSSLREDIPPVKCIVWKGGDEYESITFGNVYPFDTLDEIKRMVCTYYKDNSAFIPKFTFFGVPIGEAAYSDEAPNSETEYIPLDFLWYPNNTNDPKMTYILKNPRKTLTQPDLRFVSSDGSWASPNSEIRGRSTIEEVFLKPREGKIPVLHVFPLKYLLRDYQGPTPISEEDWNKRLAPYYPDVKVEGPYQAEGDDLEFAKKIHFFVQQREKGLNILNRFLEEGIEVPIAKVTGIRMLRLTWKKPVRGFDGCGSLFYRLLTTEKRPYLRLIPTEGSPVTKLHVKGVLPIPTLEDPRILESWGKEVSPVPGYDFCSLKYVHRPSIGITQPIYGTVQIFNDGTLNLLLVPPKQIRKLDPILDFRNFNIILEDVFKGLPQPFENFELRELSSLFALKLSMKSKKFNKTRLQQRLPYFQSFFTEIRPLPDENPIISLRYKAVSQYVSEDKTFSFITQYTTTKMLSGEGNDSEIISALQTEFQLTKREAIQTLADWYEKRGIFTVQLPDDGEFMESNNPGIDIHVYQQHPSYYFHVNRIDSYSTYLRVFTLLSLLFVEDDEYFTGISNQRNQEMERISGEIEEETIQREEMPENQVEEQQAPTALNKSLKNEITPNEGSTGSVPDWIADDPFADVSDAVNEGEVLPEIAPSAVQASVQMNEMTTVKKRPQVAPNVTTTTEVEDTKTERLVPLVGEDDQKLVNPKSWFIKKLQEMDPRLFNFKTEDQDENGYSRKCGGVDDRQPAILTKDQYERMREIYENDPIFWIVYPLEGTDQPIQPLDTEETVTLMRYGSDPDNVNYYFCPQYYCLSDEIMIRPRDFEATVDRDGRSKPANTCPFCLGRLITERKKAVPGHTVLKRKDKKGTTFHSYVDFMSKTTHPENFALPCCFLKQKTLRISDPQYSHLRSYLQEQDLDAVGANEIAEEDDTQEYDELVFKGEESIEYAVLFESLSRKYILESNKHPDPGIFAAAPAQFDKFFRQDSSENVITRVAIHLKLRPNANGFLRIGTENTIYESLLGVIAPLLYKNSINEVKERILEVMTPRIFINSHFGNLVLEFYNPADTSAMPQTKQELMDWSRQLGIAVNSITTYPLIRLFNSYKRFVRFIRDPTQRKDLRHIQPMLAEPGLFTTRGVQIIVMEDNGDEPVTVKCPTFGVSIDRNKKNDFAFISRSLKNIGSTENKYARYELYLHTSNKPARGGEGEIHETIIRWDYASRRYWPEIVQRRVDEYMTQCQSRYRSLYTSQEGINPMAMIPLSKAVEAAPVRPEGIVKDSYNHIVGLTFRSKGGASTLVALPVVDDGVISISSAFSIKNIYLDWDDFKVAPVDEVVGYYKRNLEPLFALYPGYYIKYIVRHKLDNKIAAVQLENGIYIPAGPPKDEASLSGLGLEIVVVDQFEWAIDKQIAGIKSKPTSNDWDTVLEGTTTEKGCGFDSELIRKSTYVQFEELYQQFRLMVSNWISSYKAGAGIRKGIEDIIFNPDLPEYEKRKRLYIYIASTLLSWFYSDEEKWEAPATFLRKDCRLIDSPEGCTGTCYWKEGESGGGKCLLHVDATTQLGEKPGERDVSTAELFVKRVIDELVRFPNRREQLMKRGGISKVSTIVSAIRQGDQYIIPESSPTWTNLLRLDWAKQIPEEPKYYEEMSREITPENELPPEGELPAELEEILGAGTTIRLSVPDVVDASKPLEPFQGILGVTLGQLGLSEDAKRLDKTNLIKFVQVTSKPVGIVDLSGEETDEDAIQFVRPFTGSFDAVTVFVFLPNKVGILVQEEGDPTVKISALPDTLQQVYKDASVVQLRRRPVAAPVEEERKVPLIIGQNPIMAKPRRKPLVATAKQVPLVEAAAVPVNNKSKNRTTRRKPRVAIN